jgi:hypothetical protein
MEKTDRIRALNDAFRTKLSGGQLLLTQGIAGRTDAEEILRKVTLFSEFSEDNDPHGEHDFGAFEHGSETLFWKIDYYSRDLQHGSSNPADPAVTTRVLTVMLASEY